MIDPAIVLQIRMDYNFSDDQSTRQITVDEVDLFWEWFGNEASRHPIIEANTRGINNEYHIGQCFSNGQAVTLQNRNDYYEGFVLVNNHYYLHAFNLLDGHVLDVTALSQPDVFMDVNGAMPALYYGINIPFDFIVAQDRLTECLLRSYFIECTEGINLQPAIV